MNVDNENRGLNVKSKRGLFYLAFVGLPSSASRRFPVAPAHEGFPFSARLLINKSE